MVTTRNSVSGGDGRCSRGACSDATLASSVSCLVGSRVQAAGSGHCGKLCKHSKMLRFDSLNLGTIKKKEGEVVTALTKRRMDLCAVQETRCCGGLCKSQNRMPADKDSHDKFFWTGSKGGKGSGGILLAECWVVNIFNMVRTSDRIILLKLAPAKISIPSNLSMSPCLASLMPKRTNSMTRSFQ